MKMLTAAGAALVLAAMTFGAAAQDDAPAPTATETAVFAGGCFWCVEADFEKLDGVVAAASGYTGGSVDHPTYKQVSHGGTGHLESVEVTFRPDIVSYRELTDYFLPARKSQDRGCW